MDERLGLQRPRTGAGSADEYHRVSFEGPSLAQEAGCTAMEQRALENARAKFHQQGCRVPAYKVRKREVPRPTHDVFPTPPAFTIPRSKRTMLLAPDVGSDECGPGFQYASLYESKDRHGHAFGKTARVSCFDAPKERRAEVSECDAGVNEAEASQVPPVDSDEYLFYLTQLPFDENHPAYRPPKSKGGKGPARMRAMAAVNEVLDKKRSKKTSTRLRRLDVVQVYPGASMATPDPTPTVNPSSAPEADVLLRFARGTSPTSSSKLREAHALSYPFNAAAVEDSRKIVLRHRSARLPVHRASAKRHSFFDDSGV